MYADMSLHSICIQHYSHRHRTYYACSLVPRPCTLVACSMIFTQRAWARSSCDVCRSLRHDPSTRINDVIDELAPCLPLKEAPDITVMVRVQTYLSVKSLGSVRAQAAMLSWIVDVYIQILWPHRITRSNLDFGSLSSSAQVDYFSLSYARDLFYVLQLHLWLSLQHSDFAVSGVT